MQEKYSKDNVLQRIQESFEDHDKEPKALSWPPNIQTNRMFMWGEGTIDRTKAYLTRPKDPLPMSQCQKQQDTLSGRLSLSWQVRAVLAPWEGPKQYRAGSFIVMTGRYMVT